MSTRFATGAILTVIELVAIIVFCCVVSIGGAYLANGHSLF